MFKQILLCLYKVKERLFNRFLNFNCLADEGCDFVCISRVAHSNSPIILTVSYYPIFVVQAKIAFKNNTF